MDVCHVNMISVPPFSDYQSWLFIQVAVFPKISKLALNFAIIKGTVKLYFFLLKKMPLVCTKNVTFLFFQSSTYNMLKIATFVYFAVIFSWARHRIRGPVTACTGLAIENFTCFSPSVNILARHRLHGPVANFTGPSLHFQRPRPIFMVTGPRKNDGKLFEHVIGGTLEK